MQDCKPASTPMEKGLKLSAKSNSLSIDNTTYRQLVGSLIYLSATRPDISFAVSYISRFMTTPKADHWMAAKHVFRYVKGTLDYGLLYSRSSNPKLSGFTDSNWAGSVDDKKSTSGYVFSLGSGAVTWTSKKQQAVSLSLLQRLNMKGLLRQDVKLFGFVGCLGICRCHMEVRLLYLLITKALSS